MPNTSLMYLQVPKGAPVPGQDLKKVTDDSFDPETAALHGGILLQTLALDLSPYMRGRMRDPSIKSYSPAMPLNQPVQTLGFAKVLRSESEGFKVGQTVRGYMNMSTYVVLPAQYLAGVKVIENKAGLPSTTMLGGAGMPGYTAWWSYKNIGLPKKGEAIFISAAAGAVGQIVGQLAKQDGLKVIGSAGSDDKVKFIKEELAFDVAFNYKKESTAEILKEHPFDIYYDNVGGETLDEAFMHINNHGRIIACGAVSQYNKTADERYGIKNSMQIVAKQLTMRGFIMDADKDLTDFYEQMPELIASGKIKVREAVYKGLDDGEAFRDLLDGTAEGKVVISME
ncbi:hypothetical protein BCR35DRAFT_277888 [Leucosporidium creatinivorum]|uniref:Enoyl reductase (ER) domain-containing protein n=1 Tax=Leucosporidium creatinivorum TaxID=106004 RepID=A0A1Y2FQ71_9BASI|nr:hypothetical protein BCR35DRAFT_277888 [Leucosporidium creatinivorum]